MKIMPLFIIVTAIFSISFLLMAIGLIVRGKIMRGGCGSHGANGEEIGCDACSKKPLNLCEDEDDMGLRDVSNTSTFARFDG